MAKKPVKASKTKLVCKIINMEPDPKHPGRMIVSVSIDDGDRRGPWIQGFSVLPEKVLTLEDFMDGITKKELKRPEDPYKHLTAAMEKKRTFVLNLTGKIVGQADN